MPAIVKPHSISWTEVFKRTWKEANEDDVLGRSAQLAYYFFLALFPLLFVSSGYWEFSPERVRTFKRRSSTFWPAYFLGSASSLIQKTLAEVDQAHATSKLSAGLIFSVWSASAGMSAIMDTLNAEHEVHEGRSFNYRVNFRAKQ
jgi:membrane protein